MPPACLPVTRTLPHFLQSSNRAAATLLIVVAACSDPGAHDPRSRAGVAVDSVVEPAPTAVEVQPSDCREGAYLCAGLAQGEDPRVLRWDRETPLIRVVVPAPPVEPRALARTLQDAAVAGFLAWQDKPFPLQVSRSDLTEADITVIWVERLNAAGLGRAQTEWIRAADGATRMRVTGFTLAFLNPLNPGQYLETREVQLAAAHEMGHALGLPHSNSPGDVMYPTNTATALSAEDYRAMATLYRMVNGARLAPEVLEDSGQSSR
jgi:hypothetical protein